MAFSKTHVILGVRILTLAYCTLSHRPCEKNGEKVPKTPRHERRRRMLRGLSLRMLALIIGLIGAAIAFIINILYSSFHVLGRVAGITNDQTHFYWGLLVVLIGFIGALLVLFIPIVGAVMLGIAGIAFFFIAGWWALLASPFLLIAAVLAYNHSRAQRQEANPNQRGIVQ